MKSGKVCSMLVAMAASAIMTTFTYASESKTDDHVSRALIPASEQTMFEKLGAMFSESLAVGLIANELNQLAYVGRCYTSDNQSTAVPALYLLKRANNTDGPLGDDGWDIKTVWAKAEPATYYDSMTLEELVGKYISTDSIRVSLDERGRFVADKSTLGRSGSYLVEQVGSTIRCYYFITKLPSNVSPE